MVSVADGTRAIDKGATAGQADTLAHGPIQYSLVFATCMRKHPEP